MIFADENNTLHQARHTSILISVTRDWGGSLTWDGLVIYLVRLHAFFYYPFIFYGLTIIMTLMNMFIHTYIYILYKI